MTQRILDRFSFIPFQFIQLMTRWAARPFSILTGFVLILAVSLPLAEARDMRGRLGLGYNSEFAKSTTSGSGVPAISFKYGLSRETAIAGIVGFSTGQPSSNVTAFKFFKNIYYENHLNFYFTAGAGMISANNNSGVELLMGLGAEFFIPGVESLGFSIETGATFDNATGSYAIRTLGVSFLDAGIHFYF